MKKILNIWYDVGEIIWYDVVQTCTWELFKSKNKDLLGMQLSLT